MPTRPVQRPSSTSRAPGPETGVRVRSWMAMTTPSPAAASHCQANAARARRRELEKDVGAVREILRRGAERAREEGARTLRDVQEACGVKW